MRAIDLVALHQLDVTQPGGDRLDRLQHVDEHPLVGLHQPGEGRRILIGGVEDVGDIGQAGQHGPRGRGVVQVDTHMAHPLGVLAPAPREPDHLPATQLSQVGDEVAADHPTGPDHQCHVVHHLAPIAIS